MRNEHDDAIDKVLASLRDVVPPGGMDARIAARLEQHANAAKATASGWRGVFTGSPLAGAWWRGAISGAGTVALAACLLLAGPLLRSRTAAHRLPSRGEMAVSDGAALRGTPPGRDVAPGVASIHVSAERASADKARPGPCSGSNLVQVRGVAPARRGGRVQVASLERPHHVPASGLTAQERELVRLARTADPNVLAALNPETHAKLEAEYAAEFDRFFAPPPETKMTGDSE